METGRTAGEIAVAVETLPHHAGLPLPAYKTAYSAGMDIHAAVADDMIVEPGKWTLVPTGIKIALPEGTEGQIRPRSGLAVENGVTLLNTPGTIDADYRGEVKIILINLGEKPFRIQRGDRIAQLVIHTVLRGVLNLTETLDETGRGQGGFGHTGRK